MNKNLIKKNNGVTLISSILTILFFILIAFIIYEIFYVDVFNLGNLEDENVLNVEINNKNDMKNMVNIVENQTISDNSVTYLNTLSQSINNNVNLISTPSYKYYYNQLDEYGKIIYDGIEQNKENMKSGKYTIDFDTKFNNLLNTSGGESILNTAFQSAWNAYTYDNADMFYIDVEKLTLTTKTTTIGNISTHKVILSNGEYNTYLKDSFTSKEDIDSKVILLNKIKKEIGRQLQGYSQFEQIKEVHNWLVNNIEYDVNLESKEPYSIVGALTEGKSVCEGYARSFKYILDELNIPCVLVSGIGTNSKGNTESHAWNYVMINDKWYAVDVTWDDPVIVGEGNITIDDNIRYKHFLKGSNSFLESHYENGILTPNSKKFEFPVLNEQDYE